MALLFHIINRKCCSGIKISLEHDGFTQCSFPKIFFFHTTNQQLSLWCSHQRLELFFFFPLWRYSWMITELECKEVLSLLGIQQSAPVRCMFTSCHMNYRIVSLFRAACCLQAKRYKSLRNRKVHKQTMPLPQHVHSEHSVALRLSAVAPIGLLMKSTVESEGESSISDTRISTKRDRKHCKNMSINNYDTEMHHLTAASKMFVQN